MSLTSEITLVDVFGLLGEEEQDVVKPMSLSKMLLSPVLLTLMSHVFMHRAMHQPNLPCTSLPCHALGKITRVSIRYR